MAAVEDGLCFPVVVVVVFLLKAKNKIKIRCSCLKSCKAIYKLETVNKR